MDFRKHILHNLLDKYEDSKHFSGDAAVNRKVKITFKKKEFPSYWEPDKPFLKEAIHQVVYELKARKIIDIKWMAFEKGNIIEYVALNLDKLEEAYRLAARVPKKQELQQVKEEISMLLNKIETKWIADFLQDCLQELVDKKKIPSALSKEKDERKLFFKTLLGLQEIEGKEMLERVFSLKYLGNSKLFTKKFRKKIANLALKYTSDTAELGEDDILTELGISKNSEEVLVKGSLTLSCGAEIIDYAPFSFGGIIDTSFVNEIEVLKTDFSKVLIVENKANFRFFTAQKLTQDIFLIYIGGFPGPQKRNLLDKLYQFSIIHKKDIAFYHWGDIDLGGFKIFNTIEKVVPDLKPLFMDAETLLEYRDYCEELEESYSKKAQKALTKPEYHKFKNTLELMVQEKIRLEQEALLLDECLEKKLYVLANCIEASQKS